MSFIWWIMGKILKKWVELPIATTAVELFCLRAVAIIFVVKETISISAFKSVSVRQGKHLTDNPEIEKVPD